MGAMPRAPRFFAVFSALFVPWTFATFAHGSPQLRGISLYPLSAPEGGSVGSVQGIVGGQAFGSVKIGSSQYAAMWDTEGALHIMPPPATTWYGDAIVQSVAPGVQAGYAMNLDNNQKHAVLWTGPNSNAIDLNPTTSAGFYSSQILGVGGGQAVGFGSSILPGGGALLWTGTDHALVELGGWEAIATDGTHQVGVANNQAAIWSGTAASYMDLTPPGATLTPTTIGYVHSSEAVAVSGQQQVGDAMVTIAPGEGYRSHAFLWNGTGPSAVDLNPNRFRESFAVGTNGNEQVGYGYLDTFDLIAPSALLWQGSAASAVELQALLPPGYESSQAFSIDPSGNVYGIAMDD